MVANENQRYVDEHQLAAAMDRDAPWDYRRYQQIMQLAERLYTVTRGGALPGPDEESPDEGTEPAEETGEETEAG